MSDKVDMLKRFYEYWGDFKIYRMPYAGDLKKWVLFSAATYKQREMCNMRGMHDSEVILDIDLRGTLPKIERKLKNDGYNYNLWYSGGKGYHIHLIFPELAFLNEEDRKSVRKLFIEMFGTDEAKQAGLIALENEPHFRGTGRKKMFLRMHKVEGDNKVPPIIFEQINKCQPHDPLEAVSLPSDWAENNTIIKFVLKGNIIPAGIGRYSIFCKNLSAGMVMSGMSQEAIDSLVTKLLEYMPGAPKAYFDTWINAARNGKYAQYSASEMMYWFNKHKKVLWEANHE